jgi:glycosyltransferase involved in cell wall biosynthesis
MPPADAARPLRVAQVSAAVGRSPWFINICTELAGRGVEVVAIVDASAGHLSTRLAALGIRHHRVAMYRGAGLDRLRLPVYALSLPWLIVRLAWLLRRERVDLAHSHVHVANVVTRLACAIARVPHVAGIAGPRHLEARLTRAVERATAGLDRVVACGCEYAAGLYRTIGIPADRVATIYYGAPAADFDPAAVDGRAFRRELGLAPATPLVGLIAHFYPPMRGPQAPSATRGVGLKGHDTFLAAARLVARDVPAARFVVVGGGSNERGERYRHAIIASCRADGLSDRVFFPGHRSDVPQILASFDVAVQCSRTEGLGGTIEALLLARPTVATAVGGMPEAVRHEETGLLVPADDPPALAAAILRLLRDGAAARRLGEAGRASMLERFTLARTGRDLTALYGRIAGVPQ